MTARPAQIRMNIDGATAQVPRGLGAKGTLGGDIVVYVARPDDGSGVLVRAAKGEGKVYLWAGGRVRGAADGPHLASEPVAMEKASAAIDEQIARMDASPDSVEGVLRGQWQGVVRMTEDRRPVVHLERAIANYMVLVVESLPGTEQWSWSLVAKDGKWFVEPGKKAAGRAHLLTEAIEFGYEAANVQVGKACTTRDTVRRQAMDVPFAAQHPVKMARGKAEKITTISLPKGRGPKAIAAIQAEGEALKNEAKALDTAPAKGTALKRAQALVARAAVLVEHETCQSSDQKASAQAALDRARKALIEAEASGGKASLHAVAQAVALAAARAAKSCAGQAKAATKAPPKLTVVRTGTYKVRAGETLQGQVTAVHLDGVGDGYVREAMDNGVEVLQVLAAESIYGQLAAAVRGNDNKRRPVRKAPKDFTEIWANKALGKPKKAAEAAPKAAPKAMVKAAATTPQGALPFSADDRAHVANTLVAALAQMPASVLKAA